jgi:chloramphenicol O-acetyltransferase
MFWQEKKLSLSGRGLLSFELNQFKAFKNGTIQKLEESSQTSLSVPKNSPPNHSFSFSVFRSLHFPEFSCHHLRKAFG